MCLLVTGSHLVTRLSRFNMKILRYFTLVLYSIISLLLAQPVFASTQSVLLRCPPNALASSILPGIENETLVLGTPKLVKIFGGEFKVAEMSDTELTLIQNLAVNGETKIRTLSFKVDGQAIMDVTGSGLPPLNMTEIEACYFQYLSDISSAEETSPKSPSLQGFLECAKIQTSQARWNCYDVIAGFKLPSLSGRMACWDKKRDEQILWIEFVNERITAIGGPEMTGRNNYIGAKVWLSGQNNDVILVENPVGGSPIIELNVSTGATYTLGDDWFSCTAVLNY